MAFRVYAPMDARLPLSRVAAHARRAEALGYDGLNVPESVHDGLAAATVALQATTRLRVATSVLVAFPRSPMVVALAAWDLQELSGGRFELGLGSQVRGNIVGRYAAPWSAPVPRMREYVLALRAIFACWQRGEPLDFAGEHYRFTRMQPFFRPDPLDHPRIPIHVGAVGPHMTALAGELADGLVTHPTSAAPRHLREVVLPRLAAGAARSGRDPGKVARMVSPLVASGPDAASLARERERVRRLLAFLFSTPAYRASLDLFGWRERGERLHTLARAEAWERMPEIVSDEMLATFAPQAPYAGIADVLREWYGELSDWIAFPLPESEARDEDLARVVARLRDG